MERRLVAAILLMILVAVVPQLFLKSPRRPVAPADSSQVVPAAPAPAPAQPAARPAAAATARQAPPRVAPAPAETVAIATPLAHFTLSGLGATVQQVQFSAYRMFGARRGPPVELLRPGDALLAHEVVLGRDTVRFDSVAFAVEQQAESAVFRGHAGNVELGLSYTFRAGSDYVIDVAGELGGLGGQGALVRVGLGSGFANTEADSIGNYRSYGAVGRRTEPKGLAFSKLAPGDTATLDGPFDWVAVKSKYFIGALLSPDSTKPAFGGLVLTGGPRVGRFAAQAATWATLPVGPDGRFRYRVYLGPQEFHQLRMLGRTKVIADTAQPGKASDKAFPLV